MNQSVRAPGLSRQGLVRGAAAATLAILAACTSRAAPSSGVPGLDPCEATGRLDGVVIEYWTGGGLPPPYYRSDQFRLLTAGGRDTIEFASMRHDARYTPPQLHDRWQMPARPDDVRAIARLLRETGVFTRHYAEEQDPGVADAISTEVIVTTGSRKESRRYYRKVPAALGPLHAEVERLIALVKARGAHGLYHQGKRIGP